MAPARGAGDTLEAMGTMTYRFDDWQTYLAQRDAAVMLVAALAVIGLVWWWGLGRLSSPWRRRARGLYMLLGSAVWIVTLILAAAGSV